VPVIDGSSEEILKQCATGITTCDTLSDNGGHDEIVLATHIVETYLPILQAILHTSSPYSLQAATLISKIFQVKQGTAYHLEGTEQSLVYAEEAVRYARRGEDVTELVTALHQLASIHEWPLPSLSASKSRKKALTLIEEAAYLQEKQREVVPSQIQSWVFIGQAKLQGLNGLKQEAYTSIGDAQTAFARNDTDLPGLYFNQVNLMRQEAITYSYLNEQERAIDTFLKLIEVNDAQFAPRFPMPGRTHLSLLSEVVISSLRRPAAKKDKDLTIQLWKAELQMAQRMRSVTYIREAQTAYQIMECVWPDDTEIHDLYDLLYGELY
jgi:tetratricopeptide (TPR) repeat protein